MTPPPVHTGGGAVFCVESEPVLSVGFCGFVRAERDRSEIFPPVVNPSLASFPTGGVSCLSAGLMRSPPPKPVLSSFWAPSPILHCFFRKNPVYYKKAPAPADHTAPSLRGLSLGKAALEEHEDWSVVAAEGFAGLLQGLGARKELLLWIPKERVPDKTCQYLLDLGMDQLAVDTVMLR